MEEGEILARLDREWLLRQQEEHAEHVANVEMDCESPIERVFLRAFMMDIPEAVMIFRGNTPRRAGLGPIPFNSLWCGCSEAEEAGYVGAFYPQFALGPYRVDFYLEAFDTETQKRWFATVIECDGHDFHEKTKAQARADKRRDRWFQARGIAVLRFTGSEIWEDPVKCAEEVRDAFFEAHIRHRGL